MRASGSIDTSRLTCLVKSSTTAVLTACPAMDVPAPRGSTGTPYVEHTDTAASTSSVSSGVTTPIGTRR